jgi:hypothetical protein
MPTAIDPKETFEYVLECDRELPGEQQTIFELSHMTCRQREKIENEMTGSKLGKKKRDTSELTIRTGSTELAVLDAGLMGWRNFKNKHGEEIEFSRTATTVRRECLDYLHSDYREELAEAITEVSRITEDERKNS